MGSSITVTKVLLQRAWLLARSAFLSSSYYFLLTVRIRGIILLTGGSCEGVLVAKGDVGTGTIVGSAVFNVLFVIGVCGYFSGRIVELTWWPLFRDSVFYSGTVILLIAIIIDSEVTWYESVIMMLIYGVYILLMKFNSDVHFWISRRLGIEDDTTQNVGILAQGDKKNYSSYGNTFMSLQLYYI
ncbi:hypothetical protein TNCV_1577471 [Trichonephila clavipes]|nr:hypothetical protein TNCV_1577471 [Trichonephila clavipes]